MTEFEKQIKAQCEEASRTAVECYKARTKAELAAKAKARAAAKAKAAMAAKVSL